MILTIVQPLKLRAAEERLTELIVRKGLDYQKFLPYLNQSTLYDPPAQTGIIEWHKMVFHASYNIEGTGALT